MSLIKKYTLAAFFSLSLVIVLSLSAVAQTKNRYVVLTGDQLTRIVPTSFYFAGQSAQTQMRNSSAASIGKERFVIAGLVDTSGYSTEISGKYEGFLITDSPINLGDKTLETGAYGFGFSTDGKLHIFDLSSKELLSVETQQDKDLKRPRPLMMTIAGDSVRFYKGKNYAVISAK